MLNISNSSVGSNCSYYAPISKRLKFLKHDASVCSENCDSTLERSLSFLNNTTVEVEEEGKQLRQGTNNNQEVKVVLCSVGGPRGGEAAFIGPGSVLPQVAPEMALVLWCS